MKTFTEEEYHQFFMNYIPDPLMSTEPFYYSRENISRSYIYNHYYRDHYAHYGIFLNGIPVGSFQLKRIDTVKKTCEFGIILQNDSVKNKGIGTEAIRIGLNIAKDVFSINTVYGDTSGRNKRMQRVFEKLGFILIETVQNAYEYENNDRDCRLVYKKTINNSEEEEYE